MGNRKFTLYGDTHLKAILLFGTLLVCTLGLGMLLMRVTS